ncbi:hypothetical protein RRG08_018529 [Elysia crispata]|uniref:Uncharacterized protein n=1 Tax=Elysia crispata TaxID=231223 RepID=A0AAE0YE86_9GAST|nr:hypothetical protein RRG08_018529 [Elysia crispata]
MVRNYKREEAGGRKNYSQDPKMEEAFNAVMGKKMSTYAAAKHLGVGHKALWFRTTGKIPINAHQDRSPDLPHIIEQEMVDCILLMADWGWGIVKLSAELV